MIWKTILRKIRTNRHIHWRWCGTVIYCAIICSAPPVFWGCASCQWLYDILLRNPSVFIYSLLSTNMNILQRQLQTHKYTISRRILTKTDVPKTIKKQTMHIKHNNEAHLCNHYYRGKSIIIKYSECVFLALGIQNAKRMPIGFYSIFYIISKMVQFSKKIIDCKMCGLFSLLALSETFLVLIWIEGMCIGLHVKYPLFLSYFNESRIFSTNLRKVLQ